MLEKLMVQEKIKDFVEFFNQLLVFESESTGVTKDMVIAVCEEMFQPKDALAEMREKEEGADLSKEDRMVAFEAAQGEIIFECFQDEVN